MPGRDPEPQLRLRIIDRVAMPNKDGVVRPLMQEVLEHTELEQSEGLEVLLKETKEVAVVETINPLEANL